MATFQLLVDWDQDFNFAHPFAEISDYLIWVEWRNGMGKMFQDMADEATLKAELKNPNGLFNPEKRSSPLWGLAKPKTPIKLLADGAVVWRGWLEKIDVAWRPGGQAHGSTSVMLHASGYKKHLEKQHINIGMQKGKRIDELIAKVLRFAGVPPAAEGGWLLGRSGYSELGVTTVLGAITDFADLDVSGYTMIRYGDETKAAWAMLTELVGIERGKFFFGRDGKAVFWNSGRITTSSPPSYLIDDGGQGVPPLKMDYEFGKSVINVVRVGFEPSADDSGEITLYRLPAPITLATNEQLTIECYYKDELGEKVGAQEATARCVNVVFGSGAGSVRIAKQKGDHAIVEIVCSAAGELTGFDIVGKPVRRRQKHVVEVSDDDSIIAYGRQELGLQLTALDDAARATAIANFEISRRAFPRGFVSRVEFLNANDGIANAHHLDWDMGDLVALMSGAYGHNRHYLIAGEQHRLEDGMKSHRTSFFLEPLKRDWLMDSDGNFLLDSNNQLIYA